MNWTLVKYIVEYLTVNLRSSCIRLEPAGSFRRQQAACGDLELVAIPLPGAPRPEFGAKRIFTNRLDLALYQLECLEILGSRLKDGPKYKQIVIRSENIGIRTTELFKLDLFIVRPETWGVQFAIRTGPADFSHKFVTKHSEGGWLPDHLRVEDGLLWNTKTNTVIPTADERDFFDAIRLGWIEPENRQTFLTAMQMRENS
jgi:DNA polymerase/3'-5' exonuclease PolX